MHLRPSVIDSLHSPRRVAAERFLPLVEKQLAAGATFRDALFAGYTAVLCSPEFLTIHAAPGPLDRFTGTLGRDEWLELVDRTHDPL